MVDDESDLIEMMKEMIHHLGYQPTGFTDSQRALAAFREKPGAFDVATLDRAMPGFSGVELAEAMREIRPAMPIILCTGYKDQPVADSQLIKKKPGANMKVLDSGLSRDFRRRPTLPHSLPCSTIGAEELNFRVRDGNGCDLFAIATEKTGINAITYNLGIRCIVACACDQFNCVS